MKKSVLNMVAKCAKKSAERASSSASWNFCYQPKEPKNLKERIKKM